MQTHDSDRMNQHLAQLRQGSLSLEEALAMHHELEAQHHDSEEDCTTPADLKAWLLTVPQTEALPPTAFDRLCLECIDGTATPDEAETLSLLCALYPHYARQYQLLLACRLQPDAAVVYPNKLSLKRGVIHWPIVLNWMGRVAAVALLFTAIGWYYWNRSPRLHTPEGSTLAQSTAIQRAETAPQATATIQPATHRPQAVTNSDSERNPVKSITTQAVPPQRARDLSPMEPMEAIPVITPQVSMQLALAPVEMLPNELYTPADWETIEMLDELADIVAWEEMERAAIPTPPAVASQRRSPGLPILAKLAAAATSRLTPGDSKEDQ